MCIIRVDNPRIMYCMVHAERAVNRKMGGYAKEVKELAMEMWRSCMYSSMRADYEVMWAAFFICLFIKQ